MHAPRPMPNSQPASAHRAVFLGDAPQNAGSARRIREALRPAGAEVWFVIAVAGATLLAGCTHVPVWRQGSVSKSNMVFNDRGAFVYGPRLNAQIESGSADNGGATAAGCTACK